MKLDQDSHNVAGSFLRGSSSGIKHITHLLKGEFEKPAEHMLSAVMQTFKDSLKAAGSSPNLADLDNVLAKTFETMIDEFMKIPISSTFRELVASMEQDIDASVLKNCARLNNQYAKQDPPITESQLQEKPA